MITTPKPAIYLREKITTHENYGNPTDPYIGTKMLSVLVMERCQWSDIEEYDEVLTSFSGTLANQDHAAIRSEAAEYLKNQASADAEYYVRYEKFIAKMDATEWEY